MGTGERSEVRPSRRELLAGAALALGACVNPRRGVREISGVRLGAHGGPVTSIAIAGDNRCAVSADSGPTPRLHVWDLRTRRLLHTLLAPHPVRALALVEERNAVAVSCWRNEGGNVLVLLDLDTGASVRELEIGAPGQYLEDLHAVGDARVLASYSDRGWPEGSTLWDCDSGAVVRRSPFAAHAVAGDRRAVLGGRVIWDLDTTTIRAKLPGGGREPSWGVALAPDGASAVSQDRAGYAYLWTDEGERVLTFDDQPRWIWSAAFSPDGRFLLTATDLPMAGPRKNALVLRDSATGRGLARLPGHRDHPRAVAFSPDSRLALTADRGGAVYLWTLRV